MPVWPASMPSRGPRSVAVEVQRNRHTRPSLLAGEQTTDSQDVKPLRLLSFNIQTGITTHKYRQYFTRGWKHVLPHEERAENLRRIADVVADYDLVALQEIDGGSLRSGFLNQVEYIADRAQFPYWYTQTNRDLGMLAQHGNGLLSRVAPTAMEDHKLPGAIPGRGAIIVRLPYAGGNIALVLLHLSLGTRSRDAQLDYVAQCVKDDDMVVIMGDMNSHAQELLQDSPLSKLDLLPAANTQPTFPAWRPSVALDHILVSPGLSAWDSQVLDCRLSDHLPIGLTVAPANQAA